ncbi:NAD(P)H-binding protein [Curtobacterium sp. MCJR17_043]|uniref:NAD(P)H-binding protein n=1 Tax=Curtobacterium sp. MCJR17_043 TaxID=2175660 RepID=UPI0024DFF351|nr:NAD(P)H-binding protein [Curtobacterium sp. MCJR17_043]WIB34715.1 NAD(P)H-binding protein [Curtobacterium sp. MCJR17_043]
MTPRSSTPPSTSRSRGGDAFDAGFVTEVTKDADVVIVALHAVQSDGTELKDRFQHFVDAAAAAGARLGIVGGAGSLLVAEGGPALYDTAEFPDAFKGEAKSHGQVLEALRAGGTDVDWFYVSPAAAFGSYNPGGASRHVPHLGRRAPHRRRRQLGHLGRRLRDRGRRRGRGAEAPPGAVRRRLLSAAARVTP